MRIDNITWIGEPSQPFDERRKHYPQWTYWEFRIKEAPEMKCLMSIDEHEVYLAEKELQEYLKNELFTNYKPTPGEMKGLLKAIEAYGDKREEKGRHDVQEDWAESDAGASL